jgi:RHS repeat-associated protein
MTGTGLTGSFLYDTFGNRTSRTVNGSTTTFLYDGANIVQELSGGAPIANLITGLTLDERFTRTESTATRHFLTDAIGDTIALSDSGGALQTQYTYEPFGAVTASGATSTNSFQFTGRENDGIGLYFYRARYYSPQISRFTSEDPLGLGGRSTNFYSYGLDNPTNLIDPSGLTAGTNIGFFLDWLFGRGARTRPYGPNDIQMQEMQRSVAAKLLRNSFYNNHCKDVNRFTYDTFQAFWDTLASPWTADPMSTAAQVGGFDHATAINNGNGTVTFTIPNVAGTHSFFYHAVPDRSSSTGPMSNINQVFQWTEPISGRTCGCN